MNRYELAGLISTLGFCPADHHPEACLPMADQILAWFEGEQSEHSDQPPRRVMTNAEVQALASQGGELARVLGRHIEDLAHALQQARHEIVLLDHIVEEGIRQRNQARQEPSTQQDGA